jgi:hypothetical protein
LWAALGKSSLNESSPFWLHQKIDQKTHWKADRQRKSLGKRGVGVGVFSLLMRVLLFLFQSQRLLTCSLGIAKAERRGAGTQTGGMGEEKEKERKDFLSRDQRPATTHAQL